MLISPDSNYKGPIASYTDITAAFFQPFLSPDDYLLHPGQEFLLFLGEGAA